MTKEQFEYGVRRLKARFGEKAFDPEFTALVGREVSTMSDSGFQRLVDVLIGSRTQSKPPLLADFREARLREDKLKFDNDVKGAANAMDWPARDGLKNFLAKEYPGAKSLNEAVQIQILRNQLARAERGEK